MQRIASSRQAGFTMIELVMVIVIIGILAAFAVPRFANMQGSARLASIEGAMGAVRSASNMAHAQALAENATGAAASINVEGNTTVDLVHGYPAGTANGIGNMAQLDTGKYDIAYNAGVATIAIDGTATCSFTYTQAAAAGAAATISATPTLADCD